MRHLRHIFFAAMVCAICTPAWSVEIYLIVNNSVPDRSLERESIERIYLGKKSQWSNGERIFPVVLKSGSTHSAFVKKILDRDASQFSTYWKQLVFTGRGLPPKSFETEAEIVEYVGATPGAIGYVSFVPSSKSVSRITVR